MRESMEECRLNDLGENFGMAAAAPNLVAVCFQEKNPARGLLYHRYSREGVPFESILQMVKQVDRLCDDIGYPARSTNLRSLVRKHITRRKNYRKMEKVMESSELMEQEGTEGTFLVHVHFRQNATWQGQVTWVEKKHTCQFRSALELLKLMDDALREGVEQQ